MKIRMLVSCATENMGYQGGEVYEVSDEIAKDFIRAKFAVDAKKKTVERAVKKPAEKAVR